MFCQLKPQEGPSERNWIFISPLRRSGNHCNPLTLLAIGGDGCAEIVREAVPDN